MTEPLAPPPERDLPAAAAQRMRNTVLTQTRGGSARRVLDRTPAWAVPLTAAAAVAAVVGGAALAGDALGCDGEAEPLQPGSSASVTASPSPSAAPGSSARPLPLEETTPPTTRVTSPRTTSTGRSVPGFTEDQVTELRTCVDSTWPGELPYFPTSAVLDVYNVHDDELGRIVWLIGPRNNAVCVGKPGDRTDLYSGEEQWAVRSVEGNLDVVQGGQGPVSGRPETWEQFSAGVVTRDVARVTATAPGGKPVEATVMNGTFIVRLVLDQDPNVAGRSLKLVYRAYDASGRLIGIEGDVSLCSGLETPEPGLDCRSRKPWP